MMKKYLLNIQICLLIFFLLGCRQSGVDNANGPEVIDFLQQIGNYQKAHLSEFVTELEYIPLETGDNCLIGSGVLKENIIVTKSHIFIAAQTYCYAFSRNGKFITEIGRVGQGPGEYTAIAGISIDKKKQSLYMELLPSAILEYSWDGVFRRSIELPTNRLDGVFFVRDSLFLGHKPNYSGNEEYHYFLFDTSGQIIKTFDNHVKIERSAISWTVMERSIKPFRLSDCIYVKERSNDTLYCLNEQDELIPQFVFNLGKYAYTKERRANSDVIEGLKGVIELPFFPFPIFGASNYIFFSAFPNNVDIPLPKGRIRERKELPPGAVLVNPHYGPDNPVAFPLGIYDMVNKTTRLLDTDPVSREMGLINDLDGGLSFWPFYCNSDNELVDIWQAYTMKEDLIEEYFAKQTMKDQQAHQKLRELVKNLKEDDNPVIVVAKLK